jgi:alpha-D-xyloside xylohydrolase
MKFMNKKTFFLLIFGIWVLANSNAAPIPIVSVVKNADGLLLKVNPGTMRLQVFSPRIIRITYGINSSLPTTKSFAVIGKPAKTHWKTSQTADEIRLATDEIEVRINRASGAVEFYDKNGAPILQEAPDGGKSLSPATIGTLLTLKSRQDFILDANEAIYGLGQHSQGLMNYRGTTVHLQQENPTESAVPVLISSRGYGLLWDNPAVTDVDAGQSQKSVLSWSSEAADSIDYYFMFGPKLDDVVADYRQLTGTTPMLGKWAWGFWQCKERYQSQQELLDVVAKYRENHIPIDGIIQDWQYWSPFPWGSHQFDTNRYPDPAAMIQKLHAENVHILISVWPKFDLDTKNFNELERADALYIATLPEWYDPKKMEKWYDPFDPIGRRIYWEQISKELFSYGFDGWWLDASEPELGGHWGEYRDYKTAAGLGAQVFNAYPLLHTTAVYQGQRAENSDKRVLILTRSAYAGQQRNSAIAWSGDVQGKWDVFAHQIPAGLNFSLSGIPYWNTDIGGFWSGDPKDADYQELFTRWLQFGAFCPMFRVHGTNHPKEMWRFDDATQKILISYDQLRYHLLPYIYSVAWQVTHENYSMMRPLVMDFREDTNVFNVDDQFLFGPALMVNPVVKASKTHREVYLPEGTTWTDFWTGKSYAGGQTIDTASPIETLPLFVRAGSIMPYGPSVEYAMEKADPIELRIYRGADGDFTLYEDEGDNYNYEKGRYATISFHWKDATRSLTIGKRYGSFHGLLKERTFHIVWVLPNHGAGISSTEKPDAVVHYDGKMMSFAEPVVAEALVKEKQ